MSLQFVMGPSGAGKSHYLYQWVTTESQKHPEKRYLVLVPEQFTLQAQKELVMASPQKGMLNVEVHSFQRLAHRVFEEVGQDNHMILTDVGKNFVIRKVAGERESDLKVLGSNLKKIGYISEIRSIISEFTQYNIEPDTLDELLEKVSEHPSLYGKLQDIKVVYEEFRAYLKERYITGEELLGVLSEVSPKSQLLKDSVIVLDGFTGFTPVQNQLLKSLLNVCDKMLLAVTIDSRENPYVYQHPYQLFALSKQMVTKLVELARENGVLVEQPICLYDKPSYRFQNNEALGFLETNLFRYSKERYEGYQDNIEIRCAKSPREEVDFVAQQIRRLIRTKGYRYRDIAVIVTDLEAYARYVEKGFATYNLPIFMDYKRSILLNSCVEYIRSLLAMAEQNFSYDSVFRYLRTGFAGIETEDIDILENYVIALGIRGYKKWQEKWVRKTNFMTEEDLAHIDQIRETFIGSLTDIMEVLKKRQKTVGEITTELHAFFLRQELQKRVKEYQVRFEEQGDLALEKEYAQVYRIIIDLLDQFVELLGEEQVSLKEYSALLDAGLEEAKVGIIPPGLDQIVVGDVERSRLKDVKVLFLMGANDNYIPGNGASNGFLSEYNRRQLVEGGVTLAPGPKEKSYIQKFYLYLILTKPTDQVYLTYSKSLVDGKSARPSYLIADLLKMYEQLQVGEVSRELLERELTENSAISYLIQGLQRKQEGLRGEWQELYTWYKKHPTWSRKIEQIINAAFYQKEDSILTRETARRLYGDILQNSVTRLEQFSACAYAHFLSYGLCLREREVYEFRAVDLGTLFHGAIEKFSYKLEKAGYQWTNIPHNIQETYIQESVEECIVDYSNSILYSSARNAYMITRLKRMLRRTVWALTKQLQKGNFVPKEYEISFGGREGNGATCIPLQDGASMRLRGKIDRIDICETDDKVYVKVIDYKTGEKAFDLGELCYGLQMQLVVYMNAAVEMQQKKHQGKQIIPAGLFYYRMKDPIVEKQATDAEVDNAILKELRPDGVLQNSEEVLGLLDRGFTGTSQVIPAARTQNGGLSKTSKVLSAEEFSLISAFAKKQVKDTGTKIFDGQAKAEPYELAGRTACDYCPYHSVCRFDEKLEGYDYRKLEKLGNAEALDQMRKGVDAWE